MTSSYVPGQTEEDVAANGVDTITLSTSTDYQNQSADTIAPPGDETVLTAAQSSWGEGDGLNGDILRPDSVESLIDILEKIEFDATIYSNNYLKYSNLEASVNAYDQDGNRLFDRYLYNWADHNNSAGLASPGGSSFEDQIYISAGTTDVYYTEEINESFKQRDILRDIANISSSGSPGIDDPIDAEESSYLFIRPESIRNEGLISRSNNERIFNPESRDFATLSTSAPLTIEIDQDLASELSNIAAQSQISLDNTDFGAFSTDYGAESNITIRLSEYLDTDGNIDIAALNSDQRFTLELNNNAGEILTEFDDAGASVQLRSDSANGSNYINLNATDHDAEENYGDMYASGELVDIVESVGEDTTVFELGFSEWSFDSLSNFEPETAPTSLTYYIERLSASVNTLGGNSYANIYGSEAAELTNSIQSITLDFTDWNFNNNNYEPEDIEFTVAPFLNNLDISAFDYGSDLVDISHSNFDYANFRADYSLWNRDAESNNYIGDITVSVPIHENVPGTHNVFGSVYQDLADYSQVDSVLSRLSFNGRPAGSDNSGQVELSFVHDTEDDKYQLSDIYGWGWGDQYNSSYGSGILPSSMAFNWEQFAALEITNIEAGIFDPYAPFEISTYLDEGDYHSLELSYNLYQLSDYLVDEAADGINPLNQLAVLGDSVDHNSRFVLDINAESLEDGWNIESTDITIQFDPTLFGTINASDIKIGGALPIANAVEIDNETGTIRFAAASLSDLGEGTGVYGQEALASISLNFAEENIKLLDKNADGSLMINPLTFDISVNENETIFSTEYTDDDGHLNREIISLNQMGGNASVVGQEVTLYEAKINLEQQGDGLVLGTERVIGSDASYTNLVRKGDTLTTDATWLNVGNIEAKNLNHTGMWNENARLINGYFSQTSLASGSFIEGEFVEDAREATTFTADIEITGDAGSVVDLADGIVSIQADGSSEEFNNLGKGSSNLITFQGDLNYDGRVSMKDLAYLNAGAARQIEVAQGSEGDFDANGTLDASVARDVDADFNGKIDLADLSVLDKDWGKTLHMGDQNFQGSSDVSWEQLDDQGEYTSWDNDSFKEQNDTEADADYVGSLESPTSNAIGADDNSVVGDGGIEGEVFQDPLAA
ncbi:hypothetical protein Q3Y53_11055 [Synechococcus sp. YX-04-1]|uniref:hypothetical protein n=1 Tax=Synechococcus sp. YX-04-1 TaxID=3062778 RepID=UPI0026E34E4F|nr:hypothetical protein [Synechococcus sp. YX-04-1]MDO6353080.1 hypothetical protein [Synechococcus sp. YX-04-1]